MKFSEIVDQATALLQRKGRMSCRALKMEFDLDDDQLDVLKEELIDVQVLAVDKDGKMLVWIGDQASTRAPASRNRTRSSCARSGARVIRTRRAVSGTSSGRAASAALA